MQGNVRTCGFCVTVPELHTRKNHSTNKPRVLDPFDLQMFNLLDRSLVVSAYSHSVTSRPGEFVRG